jgi:heat-inducible transcriptional repressor
MDRSQLLFKTLVECYIRDGQPVASRQLLQAAELPLSSATVRNVLATLEEKGLLASPHTSAGRVPTQRGYRLFVDRLLTTEHLTEDAVSALAAELHPGQSPRELVEKAAQSLSELSHHAGLVMVPRRDLIDLRHIEFVRLEGHRLLAIVVCANGDVQNQLIQAERPFSDEELVQAGNYLNRHFSGKSLGDIAQGLIRGLQDDRLRLDALLRGTVELAERAFAPRPTADYVLTGEASLLTLAETGGVIVCRSCSRPSMPSATSCTCWIAASKVKGWSCISVTSPAMPPSRMCRWRRRRMAPMAGYWGAWP